jgi:hypothetical protein
MAEIDRNAVSITATQARTIHATWGFTEVGSRFRPATRDFKPHFYRFQPETREIDRISANPSQHARVRSVCASMTQPARKLRDPEGSTNETHLPKPTPAKIETIS